MQKNASILWLLTPILLVLALSACGSKGPLYQTPDDNEPVTVEQASDSQKMAESQSKKND